MVDSSMTNPMTPECLFAPESSSSLRAPARSCSGRHATPAAFTLVELLTVIAIIGILAAIIIPVVGKVRSSARAAQCKSHLRQIGAAMALFASENRDTLPRAYYHKTTDSWYNKKWYEAGGPLETVLTRASAQQISVCPESRTSVSLRPQDEYGNYVQNEYGYPYIANENVLCNNGDYVKYPSTRLASLQTPSQVVMMTDSAKGQAWGSSFRDPVATTRIGAPHGGKLNVLWCDGHVSLVEKKEDLKDYVEVQ
ncbi:N-terminal cleavage protein [Opitutaceae bacterium TAV5]|nr:N-terminal cleavage protein [Opitutaceae bacterium TAV5]